MNQADVIADRLRNEADRVAHSANLKAQVEQQRDVLTECDMTEKDLDRREKVVDEAWADTWKSLEISARSPREMGGWLTVMEKLRYRVGDLLRKEQELINEESRQRDLQQKLLKELKDVGGKELPTAMTLSPVLVFAETIMDQIDRQQNERDLLLERRKKAQKDFSQAEEEYKEVQETLVDWQVQWQKAVSGLGLKGEISTLEAMDYLETLQACLDKVKEAGDLQKRIDGIDRDATNLEKEVKVLLQEVAPGMMNLPLDQAILQLRASLDQAQTDNTLYGQLTEELQSLQTEVSLGDKKLLYANEQMEELPSTTKCKKPEELGSIIGRYLEYQKLQEKIATSESTLAKIGAGTPIDELFVQAETVSADELPSQIESLRQDVEGKINPAINAISQDIGEISNKLVTMDGSGKAAEVSEKWSRNWPESDGLLRSILE